MSECIKCGRDVEGHIYAEALACAKSVDLGQAAEVEDAYQDSRFGRWGSEEGHAALVARRRALLAIIGSPQPLADREEPS